MKKVEIGKLVSRKEGLIEEKRKGKYKNSIKIYKNKKFESNNNAFKISGCYIIKSGEDVYVGYSDRLNNRISIHLELISRGYVGNNGYRLIYEVFNRAYKEGKEIEIIMLAGLGDYWEDVLIEYLMYRTDYIVLNQKYSEVEEEKYIYI